MRNKEFTSEILLDKEALIFNIEFLRAEMGPDVLISSVVKGNAYGHGIETFVPMLEECGIRHFSVFSAEEAIRVKKSLSSDLPIMILGYASDAQLKWAIENDIEFFVSDLERLKTVFAISKKTSKRCLIHLELETGMNRTGISEQLLKRAVFSLLLENRDLYILKGLCTHFAGAENISNYIRLQQQKRTFLKLKKAFEEKELNPEYTHACCSAAALRFKNMRFNMVRIGILQYGLWPNQEIKIEYLIQKKLPVFNLKRVLTWKSEIMSIKKIKAGNFIGYGSAFQAAEDMEIGVIPIGYANGYSRALSNSGTVLVHETRCLVLGNVNMNSLIIDLRNVPDVKIGDEVVLIGNDGVNEISVASFGELSNQLNYELLTRLPIDIPRVRRNF